MRTPSTETYRFFMPTEVHCGPGIAADLAAHVAGLSVERIVAVVDPAVSKTPGVAAVVRQLDALGRLTALDGPGGEPDFDYLESLRASAAPADPTLIVGIGGGSTMDSAKGLAIVLRNPGPCSQYQGMQLYRSPGVPCMTVPTLFGSGAEITPSAVFVNREKNRKGGINGRAVFPKLALVDPLLMETAPDAVAASTALDAMVHSIESYAARCATPMTRMFAADAAKALFAALDLLDRRDRRAETLALLAEGAFKAILSLMHSEQGLAGAASYPMGVFCAAPHGVAGGRGLPHALLINDARRPGLWDGIAAHAIDWRADGGGSSATALAARLAAVADRYRVPPLSRWLADADLDLLTRETHAFRGIMEQNPVDLDQREIRAYFDALAGDAPVAATN